MDSPSRIKAIICDLDGTLSANNGHRGVYEFSKCQNDELIEPTKLIIESLWLRQYKTIFLSGREEKYRENTDLFLAKHLNPFHMIDSVLFMRATNDLRKDSIIKKEIYQRDIEPKYEVVLVLDDRMSVCRMWRDELNLRCYQADYGDF